VLSGHHAVQPVSGWSGMWPFNRCEGSSFGLGLMRVTMFICLELQYVFSHDVSELA